jgi:hypothetical protein
MLLAICPLNCRLAPRMVTMNNKAFIIGGGYTTGVDMMLWIERHIFYKQQTLVYI